MAISPQLPEKNDEVKREHKLEFPLLSDLGNGYGRQLSVVHALPDYLREVYTEFGIVLPDFNGDDSWELPLATRIVIDSRGKIRSVEADTDYTRRPEPEETLDVLRSLS